MNQNDVASLLTEFLLNDEKSTDRIATLLFGDLDVGKVLKEKATEECMEKYGKSLWSWLDNNTTELIVSSFINYKNTKLCKTEVSSVLLTLARSLESELKFKIFKDFNDEIKTKLSNFKDDYDKTYIECVRKGDYIPGHTMVSKLEWMGNDHAKGVSKALKEYLEYDWDVYLLSKREYTTKAHESMEIRNNNGHADITHDLKKYMPLMELNIEVMSWIKRSYKY